MSECKSCGKEIRPTRTCGECQGCVMRRLNADRQFQSKRAKACRESEKLQAGSAHRLEVGRRAAKTKMANPEWRKMARENFLRNCHPASLRPENRADPRKIAASVSETKMKWCPKPYRQLYRDIMKTRGMKADEARRMVFDQIRHDREKAKPKPEALSPFERQQRALERGAGLVANDRITLDRPADWGEGKWGRLG